MPTKTIDARTEQLGLGELLALLADSSEIVITEGDIPMARLIPVTSPGSPRVAGWLPGATWTSDDYDEPLPDEFWTGI